MSDFVKRIASSAGTWFPISHIDDRRKRLVVGGGLEPWSRMRQPRQSYRRLNRLPIVKAETVYGGVDLEEYPNPVALSQVIADLVEADHVAAARRLLKSLSKEVLTHPDIAAWDEVLAPPVVLSRDGPNRDSTRDFQWLDEHAVQYRGKWVALCDGKLVAAADSYPLLKERMPVACPMTPFVVRIPI